MGNMIEKSSDPEDTSEKNEPSDKEIFLSQGVAALKALPRPDYIICPPQDVSMIHKRPKRHLTLRDKIFSGRECGYVCTEGRSFASSRSLKRWSQKFDYTEKRERILRAIAAESKQECKP